MAGAAAVAADDASGSDAEEVPLSLLFFFSFCVFFPSTQISLSPLSLSLSLSLLLKK